MITLRVKLSIPETDPPPGAEDAFTTLSEIHSDQAIFQTNQTEYVDKQNWGVKVTYRTRQEFVQSTRIARLERVMSQVGSNSFERRIETADATTESD